MYLYLDIETIPAQSPEVRARIAETVKAPGSMKKAETLAQWESEQKPAAVEEAIAKTALNGAYGHICCIGWAIDDGQVYHTSWQGLPHFAEHNPIVALFNHVSEECGAYRRPVIVGHNVSSFDIRFIWQRCIALGIRAPAWLPRDPKPWGNDVFDTMTAWAGSRDTISMDNLCAALGLPGKGEIDGSMVGKLFAEGRHEEIAEYCRADVERTRQIHRKMMIAFGQEAA